MMTDSDLAVRREIIAVSRDCTYQTLAREMQVGKFPHPDTRVKRRKGAVFVWKLSTLQRHDPALAERCLALIRFVNLQQQPPEAHTPAAA